MTWDVSIRLSVRGDFASLVGRTLMEVSYHGSEDEADSSEGDIPGELISTHLMD